MPQIEMMIFLKGMYFAMQKSIALCYPPSASAG